MAGVPMVQPLPFVPREPRHNRNLYYCKHCQELCLATSVQHTPNKRNALMVTLFCISYVPFGYYVVTGNEYALVLWMTLLALTAVVF